MKSLEYLNYFKLLYIFVSWVALCVFSVGHFVLGRVVFRNQEEPYGADSFSWGLLRRMYRFREHYLVSFQVGMFISVSLLAVFLSEGLAKLELYDLQYYIFWLFAVVTLFSVLQILKGFAFKQLETVGLVLAIPLLLGAKLIYPISFLVSIISCRVLKICGLQLLREHDSAVDPEKLTEMVQASAEAGTLEEGESNIIKSVFMFSDTIVREVMTPRKDIIAVNDRISLNELSSVFVKEGLSRLLVFGRELDDVKGIVISKDLIQFLGDQAVPFNINSILRKPYVVPNTKKIDELLQELRGRGTHIAVVIDEHGGVDGLVTMEDLIEELVGEVFDEFDVREKEVLYVENGDLIIDGGVLIDDLRGDYDLDVPQGEYDTIAGYVFHTLGRIPERGETISLQNGRLRVDEIEGNRITRLRFSKGIKAEIIPLKAESVETNDPTFDSKEWVSIRRRDSIG